MRTLILLLAFSGLTLGASLSAAAQDEDTPLQEAMGKLNSSLRTFRKAVKAEAPDKEAALTQVLAMQAALQAAKVEVPESASSLEADAGRVFTTAFRKDLIKVQRALLDLEVQILDEKFSEADVAIRGLLEHKKAGHDKYIEDA